MHSLRLILGDQLSHSISSLADTDKSTDVILMCEVWDEATYVKHHKKKIAFIFSAMRHFAQELRAKGYQVHYTQLDDVDNTGSFSGEVTRAIERFAPTELIVTEPGEYRVLNDIKSWNCSVPVQIRADQRFLCSHQGFTDWAKGRKQLRMEYFYREMRKQYGILMNGREPEGGEWNYDNQNRKPPKNGLTIPPTFSSTPDPITQEVMALVEKHFSDHFGDLEPFHFAVTRQQALQALDKFIQQRLCNFGDYQDAMIQGEAWMYHSHLSFYINCGLLLPLECVKAAEQAYRCGNAPLNAVEGFVRQIIGWREYVRGIYWLKMPDYQSVNVLEAKRKLPALYWGAKTRMNCLSQCVKETKQNAYAHHIQRLMVLGTFALIAGLHPDEVNEWYMIVFADAYQWVELPNVSGMILFADGGLLASKPYAASGSYINKMSDYCKGCKYKVSKKIGPDACPFNYLYWDFLIRNQAKLRGNHRLAMIYQTLERMDKEKILAIQNDSQLFLRALGNNEGV
ncbi:cryptochrome/photolyase family protein [Aliiglaciecola sp. LCG003]|uniref:cryptochrome/photolyase family protein n=1 Tax=Aliiglaciecola sp. LCG003 TaxID=3053655 RepID=UPI002572B08B|nr:cryptochrome/photolyase family protein [Aliiglaciecola sp. LCG003]WJG10760.1 cryptochrome/photolyase family protein [Aliiglaciecola sp. LCG003]